MNYKQVREGIKLIIMKTYENGRDMNIDYGP